MKHINFRAQIKMHTFKQSLSYDNKTMLTLLINYPKIRLRQNRAAQDEINRQIQSQVKGFYDHATGELYMQAVGYYKDTMKTGFPFHTYEAVMKYEITYNMNCYLSIYCDQYEFTGGAHGSTVRESDTWNLINGETLLLSSVFPSGANYNELLAGQIIGQAEEQMKQNTNIYFENYRELILQTFNEKNYYLTLPGVAFYFQQYDIAPYASGIVIFIITYEKLQWHPSCFTS